RVEAARRRHRFEQYPRATEPCLRRGGESSTRKHSAVRHSSGRRFAAAKWSAPVKRSALIVDDEREARRRLARMLGEHSGEIQIAGEAADGLAAVESIQSTKPDIVFLD